METVSLQLAALNQPRR